MGLINKSHAVMTQSVIDMQEGLLQNPFYLFNDKKALPVDYYNINIDKSTLDPALHVTYDEHGKDSSLRFNLVHDFYLYGLDRVALNMENGEYGVSGSEIAGDAYILPDTLTPRVGDYFVINMTKRRYLFQVNGVSQDTFSNGANYWRIEYSLDHNDDEEVKELTVDEFEFVSGNIGTQFASVLQKTKYDLCTILDDAAVALKNVFRGLYYNERVQTYTFVYLYRVCRAGMNSDFFYDPYMMEFIIKNKVLANSGSRMEFIDHKTNLRPEFIIKYNRSIWKILETCEKNELPSCKSSSSAQYIDDPSTIFGTRYESYFELVYNDSDPVAEVFAPAIDILDPQVIGHILENQLFDYSSKYGKYNILIKYFNNRNLQTEDIIPLERIMETENNMENYFLLPMTIFVIEKYIKKMMAMIPEKGE